MERDEKNGKAILFFSLHFLPSLSTEANTKAELMRIKLESDLASNETKKLESLNKMFQKRNKVLIEHLVLCRGMIHRLGSAVASLQEKVKEQEQNIEE